MANLGRNKESKPVEAAVAEEPVDVAVEPEVPVDAEAAVEVVKDEQDTKAEETEGPTDASGRVLNPWEVRP